MKEHKIHTKERKEKSEKQKKRTLHVVEEIGFTISIQKMLIFNKRLMCNVRS